MKEMKNFTQIIQPGILTAIQDLGRTGQGSLGMSTSGAFDRESAAVANRMAVNEEDLAVLECVVGGLEFRIAEGVIIPFIGAHGGVTVEQDGRVIKISTSS